MNKRAQQLLATAVHENGFLVALELLLQVHPYLCLFSEIDAQENVSFAELPKVSATLVTHTNQRSRVCILSILFHWKDLLCLILRPHHMQIIESHFSLDNHTIKGIWQQNFLSSCMKEHLKLYVITYFKHTLYFTLFRRYFISEFAHVRHLGYAYYVKSSKIYPGCDIIVQKPKIAHKYVRSWRNTTHLLETRESLYLQ